MALVQSGKCAVDSSGRTPPRWLSWLIDGLWEWRHAAADWRYLAGLNDYYLRDLGLSRHDVDQDAMSRDRFW
jgi:uncharacterized protein YjiS (DUF1127 family)